MDQDRVKDWRELCKGSCDRARPKAADGPYRRDNQSARRPRREAEHCQCKPEDGEPSFFRRCCGLSIRSDADRLEESQSSVSSWFMVRDTHVRPALKRQDF
jgi:hypothetical protein